HLLGRSSEAQAWSERAHALRPDESEPIEMRAVTLLDRGEVETGLSIYRDLLARPVRGPALENRHLILAHSDPAHDNATLFAAHAAWTRDHITTFGTAFAAQGERNPQRPLRVGWLSPRFERGPVVSFFTGLFEAFDRSEFHHTLAALRRSDDAA